MLTFELRMAGCAAAMAATVAALLAAVGSPHVTPHLYHRPLLVLLAAAIAAAGTGAGAAIGLVMPQQAGGDAFWGYLTIACIAVAGLSFGIYGMTPGFFLGHLIENLAAVCVAVAAMLFGGLVGYQGLLSRPLASRHN